LSLAFGRIITRTLHHPRNSVILDPFISILDCV
jgi:hypothetical protein